MWKRALPALLLAACGDFGANPGGIQDLNFARDLIDQGQVPPASAFKVEGMLSEHDLPLEGPACETTLCLRGAMALAPDEQGEPAGWLQVGLSSNVDPQTFRRPSLAIIATVDVSGSMGWGGGDEEHPTPGELARKLLGKIQSQLGEGDLIAIVTYGSDVDVVLDPTRGDRHEQIQDAIDDLDSNGSTNMEAGLERAYELADELRGQADSVRIMLFTDEQPNVGATSGGEFETMVKEGGQEGVGLTIFGLGLGLGTELMSAMAHVPGANAFSATTPAHLDQLMEQSWPWMTVELARDLELSIEASGGVQVAASYGFPTKEGGPSTALTASTVFLSKNRGALLVRLTGSREQLLGMELAARLRYRETGGEQRTQTLALNFAGQTPSEGGELYQQRAVH
ncbi:MAG: VWA domain-containing protein [Deltaproteobacteria bacterium]|nr:VWA domain-containing protein [Deltaproteobacteria bacterium]